MPLSPKTRGLLIFSAIIIAFLSIVFGLRAIIPHIPIEYLAGTFALILCIFGIQDLYKQKGKHRLYPISALFLALFLILSLIDHYQPEMIPMHVMRTALAVMSGLLLATTCVDYKQGYVEFGRSSVWKYQNPKLFWFSLLSKVFLTLPLALLPFI